MKYTRLGPLKVSRVGLGLWQLGSRSWGTRGLKDATGVIKAAVDSGINFFDTAEIYGWGRSEELLGRALTRLDISDEVVVASKIAGFRTLTYTILKAARGSLKRIGRPPDIIQYHWPPPIHASLCRVARGLEEVIDRGLAHYIGLSNFNKRLLEGILHCFHRHEPISLQIQYNLAYRVAEKRLIPFARNHGISVIVWSPLAKGGLAGLRKPASMAQRGDRVFRASTDQRLQEALELVARSHGASKAQVAIAWLISKDALPIPGTRSEQRVAEYARASEIELAESEVRMLDEVSERFRDSWGDDYSALQWLRYIPSPLQWLSIRLSGGV